LHGKRTEVEQVLTDLGLAADWDPKFDDLLDMPLHTFTAEKAVALKRKFDQLTQQLKELAAKTETSMWLDDLAVLRTALAKDDVSSSKRARVD
jgi:hypothetical protein